MHSKGDQILTLKPPKLMPVGSVFWMPLVKCSTVQILQPHRRLRRESWKEPPKDTICQKKKANKKNKFWKGVQVVVRAKYLKKCPQWIYLGVIKT